MELAFGRAIVAAVVTVAVLACAPTVMAATRYAEPGVGGADPGCPQSDPCDIEEAVEMAAPDDEVVVLPGDYSLAADALDVNAAINVRGGAGTSLPRITRAGDAFRVNVPGATVRDLYIESTSGSRTLSAVGGTTLERVVLVARAPADFAAVLSDGAVLRDSVAWTDFVAAVTTAGTGATLVNVTAIGAGASSDGVQADAADSSMQTVTLLNVIARGTGAGIRALDDIGADDVDVDVSSSNYSSFEDAGPDATVNVGPGNQTAPPSFVDAAALDFHQLDGSQTIDAGANGPLLGSFDLDFAPRVQGSAPDIGADEFPPPTQPASGNVDRFPPDTKITDGPKKRVKKRNVKFEFGGSEPGVSFECQLDDNGFEPCSSPDKLRGLKRGAHAYAVRAIDAAGNADPSPADRRWQVKKRKGKA